MDLGAFNSRRTDTSADFVLSSTTDLRHASGMSAMGGHVEQSFTGLHSMRSTRPVHDLPMSDYRMSATLKSNYDAGVSIGNSMALTRSASYCRSASYGYRTENAAANDPFETSIRNYDRRDLYASNGANHLTRETHEFLPTSVGYGSETRMSGMGSSVSSSLSLSAMGGSSRSSDTIVVTNVGNFFLFFCFLYK